MARISQSYKSMLLAVLPLAVANSEAEHAVLAGIVDSLALILHAIESAPTQPIKGIEHV